MEQKLDDKRYRIYNTASTDCNAKKSERTSKRFVFSSISRKISNGLKQHSKGTWRKMFHHKL